ncbi:hypothetical protein Poli38472_004103 [Pythium oligandrum]|uniref:dCMP deaminase n=1 Tax=Pythium oligandrum TaxID=41045 RepID=A0A8K1CQ50_PYTOL|nr:hypothetical protein Poli38472_004103 [Pythium oligandrum]|eukprot:TMW66338.1 hypothetical protein Poli38472_004103 [Pythium oligandrum]
MTTPSPPPSASTAAKAEGDAIQTVLDDIKISGRRIKEFFYTEEEAADETREGMMHFRCRCGKVRVQNIRHGYANLKQHVMVKHRDWVLENLEALTTENGTPVRKSAAEKPLKKQAVTTALTALVATGKRKRKSLSSADAASAPSPSPADSQQESEQDDTARGARSNSGVPTAASTGGRVIKKRKDYISWDDYFMSVAFLSAMRSKDPSTQVGACIVNPDKKIVGIGYNGFPNGCSDDILPWARESKTNDPLETKYPYVCHAEMNAILNKNTSELKGCTIYIALFPCNECAKLIVQSGIRHIVYLSDKYHDDWKFIASRRLLDLAGVEYRQHRMEKNKLIIDFNAVG